MEMSAKSEGLSPCPVCGDPRDSTELMPFELVDDQLVEFIKRKYPEWQLPKAICIPCLNKIRAEFVKDVLESDKGSLSALEEEVVKSLKENELLSRDINKEFDSQLTFGQRIADRVAEFGGSWSFIITFGGIIFVWIIYNTSVMLTRPFDPYPYILLNLVLSCLAAMQAPIIMMSQNRQEDKDRIRADHDYRTNLKAELEIRQLNWKFDQLLMHHWQRLLEIQRIQTEMMEEIAGRARKDKIK